MTAASVLAVANTAFPPARRKGQLPNHPGCGRWPCCSSSSWLSQQSPSFPVKDSKRARPCQGEVLPVPRFLQLIPQEIPNPNFITQPQQQPATITLTSLGIKSLPGDPVTLYFPKPKQSHSPVSFPSHKDQDSSKGGPEADVDPGTRWRRKPKAGEEGRVKEQEEEGACE